MRSPDSLFKFEEIEPENVIHIDPPPFDMDEYDIYDKKDFQKYINDMEKLVRKSFEYKQLIQFLKSNMDMNQCAFFTNVTNADSKKIKIELHHEPFTLHDLCTIVYNRRRDEMLNLDIDSVAKEVMFLHYLNVVGLIPLSITVHELVHSGYLFIPTDIVYGNYRKFADSYYPYMDEEHRETLDKIESFTKVYNHKENTRVLETMYTHVDASGTYQLPKMSEIKGIVDNTFKEAMALTSNTLAIDKYDNLKLLPSSITDKLLEEEKLSISKLLNDEADYKSDKPLAVHIELKRENGFNDFVNK